MSFALAWMAGLLALCLDLFVREAFVLDAWSPDFLAVVLLWLGTTRSWTQGAIIATTLGAVADAFAGSPLGMHMFHGLLLFYLSRTISSRVLFQGFVGRLLLGLVGGLASLFLLTLIGRLVLSDARLAVRITHLILPRILVVVAAVPFAFPIMDRLEALFVRQPERDLM
jgi:rod shape-determining protein MreD